MTLTLLVLTMLPIHLFIVVNPERAKKTVENILKPENCMPVAAVHFLFALLILSNTGLDLKWKWESALGIIGVVIFLKGIVHLFFPVFKQKLLKNIMAGLGIQALAFFAIIVDLALIYVDTKLI